VVLRKVAVPVGVGGGVVAHEAAVPLKPENRVAQIDLNLQTLNPLNPRNAPLVKSGPNEKVRQGKDPRGVAPTLANGRNESGRNENNLKVADQNVNSLKAADRIGRVLKVAALGGNAPNAKILRVDVAAIALGVTNPTKVPYLLSLAATVALKWRPERYVWVAKAMVALKFALVYSLASVLSSGPVGHSRMGHGCGLASYLSRPKALVLAAENDR
jgi:hypothetical protein